MSFFKNAFSVKKTKARTQVSRSPLKLAAEDLYRELGPKCEVIDMKIADRRIPFDIENAEWNTANAERHGGITSNSNAQKIRKEIGILQEENNMLKVKVEVLLNLITESIAELSPIKH